MFEGYHTLARQALAKGRKKKSVIFLIYLFCFFSFFSGSAISDSASSLGVWNIPITWLGYSLRVRPSISFNDLPEEMLIKIFLASVPKGKLFHCCALFTVNVGHRVFHYRVCLMWNCMLCGTRRLQQHIKIDLSMLPQLDVSTARPGSKKVYSDKGDTFRVHFRCSRPKTLDRSNAEKKIGVVKES